MNALAKRIVDLSYKLKLSHIGSCLITVDTLDHIYSIRKPTDPVILSNGHAGLALYVVLEHFYEVDAEHLLETYGIHPERDLENFIDVSTGSLGLGITIATGIRVANAIGKSWVVSIGKFRLGSICCASS